MNTQTFQSCVKRTVLAAGKFFLIITAFLSASAFAQSAPEADVSLYILRHFQSNFATGEMVFQIGRGVQRTPPVTATDVIISITLPEGAVPTIYGLESEACDFADNVVTCNVGNISSGGIDGETFLLKVKAPMGARALTITAKISANEFDPYLDNNTSTSTILLRATRNKRTRVF